MRETTARGFDAVLIRPLPPSAPVRVPPFCTLPHTQKRTSSLNLNLQLQGDPPPWVAGLVNAWTECGYIRCIEKYSKYQHIVNHAIARNPDFKGGARSSLATVDVSYTAVGVLGGEGYEGCR